MSTLHFYETNLNPSGKKRLTYTDTAINSVAIAAGVSWQEAVKVLIEQCHIRSNMPKYTTCITDMLKVFGFKKVENCKNPFLLFEKARKNDTRKIYILLMYHNGYLAMVPEKNGSYALRGITGIKTNVIVNSIAEVWEHFPGTDNRSGITGSFSKARHCTESNALQVKNVNPMGRNIGDCVVRGLSGALDCSWHDALDYLAMASDYSEPLINSVSNIHLTLEQLGFEYHKNKADRGALTGKSFCEKLSRTYFKGERIFALLGPSHCAAVLPVKQEDGSYIYKIQDSWDSSTKRVGDYWVYRPEKNTLVTHTATYKVNDTVVHPIFGKGTVLKINESDKSCILEISFGKHGIKRISADWFSKKEI